MFEEMVRKQLDASESDHIMFDLNYNGTPVQIKTTSGKSLRLGRYQNGLEMGQNFYLIYAVHDAGEIQKIKSYLIDGLLYNRQFSFMIQHYFDQYIKPLPDRSGKYKDYCTDLKFMAKDKLVKPEVKKGGDNNRLQSYIQMKDISAIGTEVDLGLDNLVQKTFEMA